MPATYCRVVAAVALTGAVLAHASLVADVSASRRDADLLKQKVGTITQFGAKPAHQSRSTTVTENEVNAYLALDAQSALPAGVVAPSVTILGSGRLSGRAVVDLDAVRKEKNPTSLFDPMSYLTGRLPVTATGVLSTSKGQGWFQLESAAIGGIPVPKMLLQDVVSYYSRSPSRPAGIRLDDPFALPARIREIRVDRGRAIILQ